MPRTRARCRRHGSGPARCTARDPDRHARSQHRGAVTAHHGDELGQHVGTSRRRRDGGSRARHPELRRARQHHPPRADRRCSRSRFPVCHAAADPRKSCSITTADARSRCGVACSPTDPGTSCRRHNVALRRAAVVGDRGDRGPGGARAGTRRALARHDPSSAPRRSPARSAASVRDVITSRPVTRLADGALVLALAARLRSRPHGGAGAGGCVGRARTEGHRGERGRHVDHGHAALGDHGRRSARGHHRGPELRLCGRPLHRPAGWVSAASVCRGSNGPLTIWYDANVSAGVTSVLFNTGSSGANSIAQLSEWSGVAKSSPLDQTGTTTNGSAGTSLTVTTTGTIVSTGELAVTAFAGSSGLASYTPGSGWASIRVDAGNGYTSDYKTSPSTGSTLSETVTSNPQTSYGATIATFKPGCGGGGITVEAASTLSFPSVTRTRQPDGHREPRGDRRRRVGRARDGTSMRRQPPSTTAADTRCRRPRTQVTAASAVTHAGNCSLPTNSISYPVTLPAAASPPTATKVYDLIRNR